MSYSEDQDSKTRLDSKVKIDEHLNQNQNDTKIEIQSETPDAEIVESKVEKENVKTLEPGRILDTHSTESRAEQTSAGSALVCVMLF